MRNRYFTLIIIVVLIFSLTACGTKKEVKDRTYKLHFSRERRNKVRADNKAYVKSAGGAGVPVAGQAGFFWRPALTAGTERHMMWPFSGRGT